MNIPKVSVCIITYNHVSYIGKCLDSILEQKTSFDFEIIVGVDVSVDGTGDIVQKYADEHPSIIRAFIHKERIGGNPNYKLVHEAALGEYVSHMDGDDAMLPGKLQKQYDFLEQHIDCAFVAHKMISVKGDVAKVLNINPTTDYQEKLPVSFLVENYLWFDHSSKMYRRENELTEFNDPIDFEMHIEHAVNSNIGFINEILGIKRVISNSITDVSGERLERLIHSTLKGFDKAATLGMNIDIVKQGCGKYCFSAAIGFAEKNEKDVALKYMDRAFSDLKRKSTLQKIMACIRNYTPFAFLSLRCLALMRRLRSHPAVKGRVKIDVGVFENARKFI